MTHKNNPPPFEEEQKQLINEEQLSLQEILSQFQQPIPPNFIELEQLKWMCSTLGWKEPGCERYGCLINGEWKQVDIRSTLLEKLELEKNIPYPVYISPMVLDKGLDNYFAYNVENEGEIFLIRPLAVNDLPAIFQGWITEIEKLKSERDDYRNKWDNSMEELEQKGEIIKSYLRKIEELEGEKEENQKTIEDLKKQLAEINEKGLKIKELEEDLKQSKSKIAAYRERLEQDEKVRRLIEKELEGKMGKEGLNKMKNKVQKKMERLEAKIEVDDNK
jgi:hypothetical protein